MRGDDLDPSPILPVPRILMEGASLRAPPLSEAMIFNPGEIPCSACETLATGRFANAFESTVATAAVRLDFFCVPKATTTTSSIACVSSDQLIARID